MSSHGHAEKEYIPPPGMTHETKDISTRVVVWFGIALVVAAAVIHAAVWGLQLYLGNLNEKAYVREYPLANVGKPQEPPAPRLQTQPRQELKNMRAEEDRVLRGYGWADPQTGKVQIPIDRAMEHLLQQGLPARAAPAGAVSRGLPQDSSSGRTWTGGQ